MFSYSAPTYVLETFSSSLTNIDNIPMKKNISYEFNRSNINSLSKEIIEETPYLRSTILLYDISIYDNYEAQKYLPKSNDIQLTSKSVLSLQSHEKVRHRLFLDSPKQDTTSSISRNQPLITTHKTRGVIKQLFTSPSSSPSNINFIINDKCQKLF
ncbi:unnamed protein product [Rotaria sordida]|uniref:Uncharacterized protein n=1 Tax=Rotaria sordida TaxID=392033 RepID=A0A814LYD9_9BILA|nr:unnamed protein product [Rotaria sordida]